LLVPAVLLWRHVPRERPRWRVLFALMWLVAPAGGAAGRGPPAAGPRGPAPGPPPPAPAGGGARGGGGAGRGGGGGSGWGRGGAGAGRGREEKGGLERPIQARRASEGRPRWRVGLRGGDARRRGAARVSAISDLRGVLPRP